MNTDTDWIPFHADLTRVVIGTFFDVYNELGPRYLESVYEASMAYALADAGLSVERQKRVAVYFRGRIAGEFRLDLLVEGVLAVELKAAKTIDPTHEAQLLNYLRATRVELGLLLNFGPKPKFRRFLLTNDRKPGLP